MAITDLSNRRVTVMGLGRFGGGVGAVQYLLSQNAKVTLTDLQSAESLQESLSQIEVEQLDDLVLGRHREEDFVNADLIVANPGVVARRNRYLQAAQRESIPITTEVNLFWERCRGKKIIVTGTVGKSTTAALIHHLLKSSGLTAYLGGNIGVSLLPEVEKIGPDDWVVLELSSFQLAYLDELQPSPEISVVTNFFPNHLDWHGDLAAYRDAKQAAVRWQTGGQSFVFNADDKDLSQWKTNASPIFIGQNIITFFGDSSIFYPEAVWIEDVHLQMSLGNNDDRIEVARLPAEFQPLHQQYNLAAALAVASLCDINVAHQIDSLSSFRQLPHRLEPVAEHNGIRYVNDSKATTVNATMAALESISEQVVLIAGGKDQRVDVSQLCQLISDKVKAVALIGDTALIMALLLPEFRSGLPYSTHNNLESAFRWCHKHAEAGDVVLLSPGCSSDSQFLNFEDRGRQFRQLVSSLSNQESSPDEL